MQDGVLPVQADIPALLRSESDLIGIAIGQNPDRQWFLLACYDDCWRIDPHRNRWNNGKRFFEIEGALRQMAIKLRL